MNLARQLILTGRPIDAQRAFDVGLVNVLTQPGQALDAALSLAQEICSSAPVSVQAALAAINGLVAGGDDAGWAATTEATDTVLRSADCREGVSAFLEKRPPVWTGR